MVALRSASVFRRSLHQKYPPPTPVEIRFKRSVVAAGLRPCACAVLGHIGRKPSNISIDDDSKGKGVPVVHTDWHKCKHISFLISASCSLKRAIRNLISYKETKEKINEKGQREEKE